MPRPSQPARKYAPPHRGGSAGERPAAPGSLPPVIAGLFLVLLGIGALTAGLPPAVPGLYLGASLVTFAVYAGDKSAAQRKRRRTRESTLHLLALAGGWPGALVAQHRLRHKSRKAAFQRVFLATVLANCAGLGWLSTAGGRTLRLALAALAYFAWVFAAGFVLGLIRVPLLVPRLGVRWAELLEMPVMLAVIVLAARRVVARHRLASPGRRLGAGLLALACLLLAELGLMVFQGLGIADHLAGRDPISGSVYAFMLLLLAVMPSLVLRKT